ncbi:cingulin isoform X2 [Boleophthalmus pectinirostris]|uniref:cingulin isoform X2 n=1 Tax=Boleophthalmus pectinirostris TaxID=150288 RepID=UPI00242BF47B|nr:cingulin isoform X2 [Boleophthalmus pectinirostris]
MSSVSGDRKPLVDYGVQIRFIKDLHDAGSGLPDKTKAPPTSAPANKYGVAVRVQGISGQPYVVLKDGEKGDSYGVQLNTPSPSSGPPSPYSTLAKNKESPDFVNPYSPTANSSPSPVSAAEEEIGEIFGSPLRRPPGDGQAGTQGEDEAVPTKKLEGHTKVEIKATEANKDQTSEEKYNEAGLKPVRPNGLGPKGVKSSSYSLNKNDSSLDTFPDPPNFEEEAPAPAIDTKSLAPINKLISKFNSTSGSAQQTRGRTGARQRLKFDERRRSRSLDARKEIQTEISSPISTSPTVNPYGPPLSSSSNSILNNNNSLGRKSPTVAKVSALEAPKLSYKPQGKFVTKDTPPAISKKPEILPKSFSTDGEETRIKQAILNILKEGSNENEMVLRRKANNVYETTKSIKTGANEGSLKKNSLEDIQEQLIRYKRDLQLAHDELTVERMSREAAESRLRLQEDQLAGLQEELRRVSEFAPPSDSIQTDLASLQAELAEATMLRQRQEETLRQRERELTALKGALKEEVECHDREMETLREQYSVDMENLRRTMEQVTQSQEQIEEERERVNASVLTLEDELERSRVEGEEWKKQLDSTNQELTNIKDQTERHCSSQKLAKTSSEKEEFEKEVKSLKESMRKQGPGSDLSGLAEELRRCHEDLKRARADLEKQKGEMSDKTEALLTLRKSSMTKEAELHEEIRKLKEQSQKDRDELERIKELSAGSGKTVVDYGSNSELQEANSRLRERLARMTRLHATPRGAETEEAVEALEDENRALKSQLEEAKRATTRLTKERDELNRRLEERDLERDALRRGKSDLEEQKRLLDRALDKINKEMEMMMGDSRQSVAALQSQLEEYRERSRKDLQEAQRNCKDRLSELQRAQGNLKAQQEEVSRLKKDLLTCSEERDSAQLERDLLSNRLKHLESELETEKTSQTDRSREIRGLEDKIKSLEIELDEEKSGVELLNDRITRSRDQVDQLRSELMQERAARHDLEMDKSALERQIKELRTRVADMEGQNRPAPGLALMESKIQELEERLRSEEREKASILASQRRTERKLKELNATLDQERTQHVEQRDQLTLRVKALKRQVDESELEVERLEGVRRKVLRDLEEQQELQEALQAKVSALESELKRKGHSTHRSTIGSTLSSEDEDGFYDTSLSTILNESHLQTSNC